MITIKINVTQEDIDKGIQGSCVNCPTGLALQRTFPSSNYIHVDTVDIEYGINPESDEFKSVETPQEVIDFIDDFDNGKPVKPFFFELELR